MARFRLAKAQSTPAPGLDQRPAFVQTEPAKGASARRLPFARTVSPSRWREYRRLLGAAQERGYELWSLEDWLRASGSAADRVIILRHDVDQHPRSVLPMLAIERELGVHSTWYFRWRTAAVPVLDTVRAAGGHVGFHYETLTRLVRERGLEAADVDAELVAEARALLRREITAFQRLFGPIDSVCPHGDSRVPGVSNQILLEGQTYTDYGIDLDGNDAINRYPLALWLTDRSIPDGRWKQRLDPHREMAEGTSPILLVVHPNNWCSGVSLWGDRLLAAALAPAVPGKRAGRRFAVARTGNDEPPAMPPVQLTGPPARAARTTDFAPVCDSLHREVLRFYYDAGRTLTGPAGMNTLATNAELAESRAAMLEYALVEAGTPSMSGLDVLDIGCGFGALALVFAAHGARVLAVDPNLERMQVGRTVAEEHDLPVRFRVGTMEEAPLSAASFDVAVMNNSLCYLVGRRARRLALRQTLAALRPGGVLLIRNPNRLHPRDQFTGIPLVGLLPPIAARAVAAILGKHRSRVRLVSNRAARRELHRAGFSDVRSVRRPRESRLRAMVTGYQHLRARRPARHE